MAFEFTRVAAVGLVVVIEGGVLDFLFNEITFATTTLLTGGYFADMDIDLLSFWNGSLFGFFVDGCNGLLDDTFWAIELFKAEGTFMVVRDEGCITSESAGLFLANTMSFQESAFFIVWRKPFNTEFT